MDRSRREKPSPGVGHSCPLGLPVLNGVVGFLGFFPALFSHVFYGSQSEGGGGTAQSLCIQAPAGSSLG